MLQRDRQRQRERGTFSGGGAGAFTAEYLVVAGGGGGGNFTAGGGGAGGYRSSVTGEASGGGASAESALSIALGTAYTITVGAGGAGGPATTNATLFDGTNGQDSVFGLVTSDGGGGGAKSATNGFSGGSGGGGGGSTSSYLGGNGTSNQGYNGGASGRYGAGGGGGAGAVGANGVVDDAGDGGDGVQSSVDGSATYRAGGGGGGTYLGGTSPSAGVGGLGGGGNGGNTANSGTANTGGGGGGGNQGAGGAVTNGGPGGNGGSGVVIIRVPSSVVAEFSAGVVYNYIPLDDFNVYEITAAGVSDTVTFSQGAVTTVGESLRFNDNDSAHLSRTPAVATSGIKFTWSSWLKGEANGNWQTIFFSVASGTSSESGIRLEPQGNITVHNGSSYDLTSTAVYRDFSAWFHLVVQYDSSQPIASDRIKVYVNGKQITSFVTANYPALNFSSSATNSSTHRIGRNTGLGRYWDGYMADVYLIDGEALDPSRFGKQDADGIWQPISYTGTYGTNGFHLDFADNSTAAALGTDVSGNGNDWTPSGITTDDQVTDTPSVNYATLNPLDNNGTLSDGNLKVVTPVSATAITKATFAIPQSGKWYFEVLAGSSNGYIYIGDGAANVANSVVYRGLTGDKRIDGTFSSYGATYTSGDLIGVAVNVDDGEINFYKNNVDQGTISYTIAGKTLFPAISDDSSSVSFTATANFGQLGFAYTPPTGFQALNSSNLPAPVIADGKEHFQPVLYTGNGTTQAIGGLEFQPDMVWIKNRDAAYNHWLQDAVRGAQKQLNSNTNSAETSYGNVLASFETNGFTVNSSVGVNASGQSHVAWNWNAGGSTVTNTDGTLTSQVRANPDAGFSIVTFTGTTSNQSVGHGLGVAPTVFIVKSRASAYNWWYYTTQIDGSMDYLVLNGTNAAATGTQSLPTSSVFYQNQVDSSVAYCFAEVEGFSKFGSYTGNGSADGPFVYTGFRPAFVMVKRTDAASSWIINDSRRNAYNVVNKSLFADDSLAEDTPDVLDFLSNGFKLKATVRNNVSGGTYIFMAFAENPFKTARAR